MNVSSAVLRKSPYGLLFPFSDDLAPGHPCKSNGRSQLGRIFTWTVIVNKNPKELPEEQLLVMSKEVFLP